MRRVYLAMAILAIGWATGWAAQAPAPGSQDGPMSVAPPDAPAPPPPQPLADGSYRLGPGISPPQIIRAARAVYPAGDPPDGRGNTCVIDLTVGADGMPADVHVARSLGDAFDAAALEAVRQSKFQPGSRDGHAVPVRVHVWVPFFTDRSPTFPEVKFKVDSQPRVLHSVDAEYTDEARLKKIKGVVVLSLLVTEEGLPTDIQVVRPLGHGLDEKALEAAGQYRFKPATRDGKPVATRVNVEMNFTTY